MPLAVKPTITIDLSQSPQDQIESVMGQLEDLAQTLPRLVFLRMLFDAPDHMADADLDQLAVRADALFPGAPDAGNERDRLQWMNWMAANISAYRAH